MSTSTINDFKTDTAPSTTDQPQGSLRKINKVLHSIFSAAGATGLAAIFVRGMAFSAESSIARPSNTTAYTAGDVVGAADTGTPANAGEARFELTNIGPSGGHVLITDVHLRIDVAAIPSGMTTFRLHLYNAQPAAVLDNAAWDLSAAGDRTKYLGYVDIATPTDLGSTLFSQNAGFGGKLVKLASGSTSLWGLLQTVGGFTPSSGTVKTITVNAIAA